MRNHRYLIVDIQQVYKTATGSDRVLGDAEKINLVKFIMSDAILKSKGNSIVRSSSQFSYEGNFEEPFIVNENTIVHTNGRSLAKRHAKQAGGMFKEDIFTGRRRGPGDSFHHKYLFLALDQKMFSRDAEDVLINNKDIEYLHGKLVIYSKKDGGNEDPTMLHNILKALNFNYKDQDTSNNANFAHYY